MVHFYRNAFSHVPAGKLREVALLLKAIHAQEDIEAAQRKAGEVVARLHSMRLGKAAELVEMAVPETLAYYAFPEEHWRRIRTTDEIDKGFFIGVVVCLARATSWRSAARRLEAPPGALFFPCRIEALAHLSGGGSRLPARDETGVVALGLFGDLHLLVAQRLDVVGIGWSAPIALCLRLAGLQLHRTGLVGDQCGARPQIVFVLGQ